MSSYVASTRVERREDLFIFRPFPRHLYTRAQTPGPELLLQVWRKDAKVDLEAPGLQYMPRKTCPGCAIDEYKHDYETSEWAKEKRRGNLFLCISERKKDERPC